MKSIFNKISFIYVLSFLAISVMIWSAIKEYTSNVTLKWSTEFAEQNAKQHLILRKFYTDKIIKVVKENSNIPIGWGPDRDKNNSIPLPLTLMFEISEEVQNHEGLIHYKIYSENPFSQRSQRVLDPFQKQALKQISAGENIVYELGDNYVRAAVPDPMVSGACIDCHNTLEMSTKKDWHLGEIAGVVETQIPISKQLRYMQSEFYNIFAIIFITILFVAALSLFYIRRILMALGRAKDKAKKNEIMAGLGITVAGVAHEINTPLGTALTSTTYLRDKLSELKINFNENKLKKSEFTSTLNLLEEGLDLSVDNIKRAAELITCFKQVSVEPCSPREFQPVNLKLAMEDCLSSFQQGFEKKKINVEFSCSPIKVKTSAEFLHKAITNILQNAETHAFSNGHKAPTVMINVERKKNEIEIIIKDNGCGITKQDLPHIFSPFYTTDRSHGSTGLGLSVAYNAISSLKGNLAVSTKEGQYTCFHITLPAY